MRKNRALTIEEHGRVGAALHGIREELVRLAVDLGNAYGTGVNRTASRALEAVDQLRSDLEDRLFSEHPKPSRNELMEVYYPGTAPTTCSLRPQGRVSGDSLDLSL